MSEFDDLLIAQPLLPEPAELRAGISRDAKRVQRRRRWFVRGRRIAAAGSVYVAGMTTMWGWRHSHDPQQSAPAVAERPVAREPAVLETAATDSVKRFDPPERIEKRAFVASGEKRVDLYRQAGDGFLLRDDVPAALRRYRKALDGGSAADLAIHSDRDTWLYMSLKVARQKEKADAR